MGKRLSSSLFALCMSIFLCPAVYSDTPIKNDNEEAQIQNLTQETQELHEELKELKGELKTVAHEKNNHARIGHHKAMNKTHAATSAVLSATLQNEPVVVHHHLKTLMASSAVSTVNNAAAATNNAATTPTNSNNSSGSDNTSVDNAADNTVTTNNSDQGETGNEIDTRRLKKGRKHRKITAVANIPAPAATIASPTNTPAVTTPAVATPVVTTTTAATTTTEVPATATSSTATATTAAASTTAADNSNLVIKSLYYVYSSPQYLLGIPVIISPFLGAPPAYDASDLIINFPNVNTDLLVLEERQTLGNVYTQNNLPPPTNTFLALSGSIVGQVSATSPYVGRFNTTTDVPASNVSFIAGINKWFTGFVSLQYDNTGPTAEIPPRSGPIASNSRVFIDQSFITIGSLADAGWYGTIGQIYVPFGAYNSFLTTGTLTSDLFQTKARAVLLGYTHGFANNNTVYLQMYGFSGDSRVFVDTTINTFGANLSLLINRDKWSLNVGAGGITNVANALGMQLTGGIPDIGNSQFFAGFAQVNANEVLRHFVPGADVNGTLTIGSFSLVAEDMMAVIPFSLINAGFIHDPNFIDGLSRGHGAKPQAGDFEANYKFNIGDKPSSIAVGIGETKQALAFILPAESFGVSFTTSLLRNTVESIGIAHDIQYTTSDHASGQRLSIAIGQGVLGRSSNIALLQVSIYF